MNYVASAPVGQSMPNKVTFGSRFRKKPPHYYENLTLEQVGGRKQHPRYYEIMREPWMEKIDGMMRFEYAELQFTEEGWRDVETKWEMPVKLNNNVTHFSAVISLYKGSKVDPKEMMKHIEQETGTKIHSILGEFMTAIIPLDLESMKKLALMPEIKRIEQSR